MASLSINPGVSTIVSLLLSFIVIYEAVVLGILLVVIVGLFNVLVSKWFINVLFPLLVNPTI